MMGTNNSFPMEKPAHRVNVPDFYLAKYEVTQELWNRVMGKEVNFSDNKDCLQCPIDNVSWEYAQEFIRKLNANAIYQYRLPSEAEWEYAAGNGRKHTLFSWGLLGPKGKRGGNVADLTGLKADPDLYPFEGYNDGYENTAPVGQFNPNEFGLYDMSGNVWEWCEDFYHDNYDGAPTDGSAWIDPAGEERVFRGGGYNSGPPGTRVTARVNALPTLGGPALGLRLARSR